MISKRSATISSNPTILENEVRDDKMLFHFQDKNINLVEELPGANDMLYFLTLLDNSIDGRTNNATCS